jgi:hypothetical protein
LTNSNLFFMFFVFAYFYVIMFLLVPLCKLFYVRQFFANMISFSELYIDRHVRFINMGFFSSQLISLFNKLNAYLKREVVFLKLYVKYKLSYEYILKSGCLNKFIFFLLRANYLSLLKTNKSIVS